MTLCTEKRATLRRQKTNVYKATIFLSLSLSIYIYIYIRTTLRLSVCTQKRTTANTSYDFHAYYDCYARLLLLLNIHTEYILNRQIQTISRL